MALKVNIYNTYINLVFKILKRSLKINWDSLKIRDRNRTGHYREEGQVESAGF